MNEKLAAQRLRASVDTLSPEEPHLRFAEVRRIIAATLRDCCQDGYSLRRPSSAQIDPNEVVGAMVERSSRLLAVAQQIDESGGSLAHDILNRGQMRIGNGSGERLTRS